jgi:5-methyltetrahydropteroyltriglutamate--homocysteine methyltransferase
VADGVPYIQVDAPAYTRFMVNEQRDQLADPQAEFDRIVAMENALLAEARGPGVTSAVHICLGTFFLGDPSPLGGQPPVMYDPEWTGKLFAALEADVFQIECTGRARAGALQALRDVPHGKVVALGVINIRDPRLESQADLLRIVEEAARYIPVENLALISNCGFAGNSAGAFLTEAQQRQKLELLVDTAQKVWP